MNNKIELLNRDVLGLEALLIWCQNSQELLRLESSVRSQIQLIQPQIPGMRKADSDSVKRLVERSRGSLRVIDRVRAKGHDLVGRIAVKANRNREEIAAMEADGRLPPAIRS